MSVDPDRFKKPVVETLAKRSAYRCSNPDCNAITSGPSNVDEASIVVGEAAHIYGAKPGAARHNPKMTEAERSAITNAIWLCRNCHKIVDADPNQFPAALLYEWRSEHEKYVSEHIGKTGEKLRRRVLEAELEGFQSTTYLARQIIIDKPFAWEFRLTAELLRSLLEPVVFRWRALKRGLYAKPINVLAEQQAFNWLKGRLAEISNIVPALSGIMNKEFAVAWGVPGESGSSTAILRTCKLFEEACQQLLVWEESVRFTSMPPDFRELQSLLSGVGGHVIEKVCAVSDELAKVFAEERPEGQFDINIVIDLPSGWEEECGAAIKRLLAAHGIY